MASPAVLAAVLREDRVPLEAVDAYISRPDGTTNLPALAALIEFAFLAADLAARRAPNPDRSRGAAERLGMCIDQYLATLADP